MARVLALFNTKARKWVDGRTGIFQQLEAAFAGNTQPVIWMHCASLGEFEQGRPVLEQLRAQYPGQRILLTFFSPSGYEIRKNYAGADWVFYLPMDSPTHARRFMQIVQPQLVLFVKYEFWYYYLQAAQQQNIPLLLISGIFRSNQPFFQWYGSFHRRMLSCFTHFFVQNATSVQLLQQAGYNNVSLAGDTRFDRVLQIAQEFTAIDAVDRFCKGHAVIVAGSTWTEDDKELDHFANTHTDIRFVIAPHDIGPDRIKECMSLYRHAVLYSNWIKGDYTGNANVLIIDNIGMLSRLYHYATICYVGGGFGGDGIHNILEAAVYHKPVVFGPVYDKYFEAVEMLEQGGAISVPDALHLESTLNQLLQQQAFYTATAQKAGDYVRTHAGATNSILQYFQEKRLLTS
ncbi:3-deoxy-D-manno-octulosonic acid transferase [Filimonas zeae]|uniref:3-deoxy-D-manno-octulosonic acid transferase n=2 Tax=Filimonas zeae TaxID=1737353 RepID=A0A917IMZ2_9BACT|nr:3-deoxy-D-manno-octulosonic acid transferase [Filimonas zeae]